MKFLAVQLETKPSLIGTELEKNSRDFTAIKPRKVGQKEGKSLAASIERRKKVSTSGRALNGESSTRVQRDDVEP